MMFGMNAALDLLSSSRTPHFSYIPLPHVPQLTILLSRHAACSTIPQGSSLNSFLERRDTLSSCRASRPLFVCGLAVFASRSSFPRLVYYLSFPCSCLFPSALSCHTAHLHLVLIVYVYNVHTGLVGPTKEALSQQLRAHSESLITCCIIQIESKDIVLVYIQLQAYSKIRASRQ